MRDTVQAVPLPVSKEVTATRRVLPIETKGLVFEAGGRRLIDGIDLKVTQGAVTMILGANGAGKSLLLRLMHGLLQPTAGAITWGGLAPTEELRKRQAMMFQRPVLLRRSVAANIDFVLGLRGGSTEESRMALLEKVGLAALANQPARSLSGGEQQRLALARALALRPEILFLDEPTASLDPASVLMIEQIVDDIHKQGTKIIFVTHDIGQAKRHAHEVIFLYRGKVAERTSAKSFFEQPQSRPAADYLAGRIVL